jgi:hypothetical protein
VRFEYDTVQQLLLITFDGELKDPDLVDAYRIARAVATKREIKRGVLDGTRVSSFSVSANAVKLLATQPPMLPENSDRCIVVEQDYLYGMARMYQMLGGDTRERLNVVHTLQEAFEYLKIQPPTHLELIAE